MNSFYAETTFRHYELVMKEAHPGEKVIPEICRRESIEKLFVLEKQIGIFSVNFIDEFHRINLTLQKAVMQLYSKYPACKNITSFMKDLSAARNCHDLLAVADAVYICFLEKPCCSKEL